MTNVLEFTDKLDIEESAPKIEIKDVVVKFNEDSSIDVDDDYKYTRGKLIFAIEASESVLKHAINDMSDNPGPRPVEAVSSLIKTQNDTCDRLISLHDKMKKIKPKVQETVVDEKGEKKITGTVNDIIDAMHKE